MIIMTSETCPACSSLAYTPADCWFFSGLVVCDDCGEEWEMSDEFHEAEKKGWMECMQEELGEMRAEAAFRRIEDDHRPRWMA